MPLQLLEPGADVPKRHERDGGGGSVADGSRDRGAEENGELES